MNRSQEIIKTIEPNRESISWIELIIILGYCIITILLLIDLVSPANIILFYPALSLTIPRNIHSRFPFFSSVADSVNNLSIDSNLLITILGTLIVFAIQVSFVLLFILVT